GRLTGRSADETGSKHGPHPPGDRVPRRWRRPRIGRGGMVDSGDTAWMLASAALVLFMTPGLAVFFGGLVRSKNVLGTMMHSVAAIAIVSVVWLLVGYSLAFGPDVGGVIGGLSHPGLGGVSG